MPGIDLAGERRLLLLWLVLTIAFGLAYYVQPTPTLLERFERGYYEAYYWNRPIEPVSNINVPGGTASIGVVTPRYISTLLDSEMWLAVKNSSTTKTITPTIVIQHTAIVTRTNAAVQEIDAQVLMREGEARNDLNTDSRNSIFFGPILPGATVTRLVWLRLLPLGYKDGDSVYYLLESDIDGGYLDFQFRPITAENTLATAIATGAGRASDSYTYISTRDSLERAFVRTLLLPPWSNGLLVLIALVCALIVNSIVSLFEERFKERKEEEDKRYERAVAGRTESPNGQ